MTTYARPLSFSSVVAEMIRSILSIPLAYLLERRQQPSEHMLPATVVAAPFRTQPTILTRS